MKRRRKNNKEEEVEKEDANETIQMVKSDELNLISRARVM